MATEPDRACSAHSQITTSGTTIEAPRPTMSRSARKAAEENCPCGIAFVSRTITVTN